MGTDEIRVGSCRGRQGGAGLLVQGLGRVDLLFHPPLKSLQTFVQLFGFCPNRAVFSDCLLGVLVYATGDPGGAHGLPADLATDRVKSQRLGSYPVGVLDLLIDHLVDLLRAQVDPQGLIIDLLDQLVQVRGFFIGPLELIVKMHHLFAGGGRHPGDAPGIVDALLVLLLMSQFPFQPIDSVLQGLPAGGGKGLGSAVSGAYNQRSRSLTVVCLLLRSAGAGRRCWLAGRSRCLTFSGQRFRSITHREILVVSRTDSMLPVKKMS